MAKNKKWSKVIARIQALEDALTGFLSAKPRKKHKAPKTKAKAKAKKSAAPAKRAKPAAKKTARAAKAAKPTRAAKPVKAARPVKAAKPVKRPRKKTPREIAVENAPILPGVPLGTL
jgi:hypothetical protein